MCNCTACCMQEWQESSLCPSPTAADLSKDIPASCILLMSPLHQPAFVLVLIHLKCVWVMFELNTLVWLVEGPVLACKTTYLFFSLLVWFHSVFDLNIFDCGSPLLLTLHIHLETNKVLSLLYLIFFSPFCFQSIHTYQFNLSFLLPCFPCIPSSSPRPCICHLCLCVLFSII